MIEGWIIYHAPGYAYVLRKFYGWGRRRVLGPPVIGDTREDVHTWLPFSRGLHRVKPAEPDVVEVWMPRAAVEYARWRQATRRSSAGSRSSP